MPDLHLVSSWGQLFLILIGIVVAVKYLYPIIRDNGGNGAGEWRGKVEQLLLSNSELLHEMAQSHQDMKVLLMELERRSREQEDAIRVVLHKGGFH